MKFGSNDVNFPVKPFRFIAPNRFPKKIYNAFQVSLRPILLEKSKAPDLILPNASDAVSSETIDSTFGTTRNCLKSKYDILFANVNNVNWIVIAWHGKQILQIARELATNWM